MKPVPGKAGLTAACKVGAQARKSYRRCKGVKRKNSRYLAVVPGRGVRLTARGVLDTFTSMAANCKISAPRYDVRPHRTSTARWWASPPSHRTLTRGLSYLRKYHGNKSSDESTPAHPLLKPDSCGSFQFSRQSHGPAHQSERLRRVQPLGLSIIACFDPVRAFNVPMPVAPSVQPGQFAAWMRRGRISMRAGGENVESFSSASAPCAVMAFSQNPILREESDVHLHQDPPTAPYPHMLLYFPCMRTAETLQVACVACMPEN